MQATAFAGVGVNSKRVAFTPASRSSHIVRAATVLPKQFKAVKPVGDRVLVKVDQEEKQTTGGVLLPTVARNKPTAGAIVSIGQADTVKVGERVVYSKYAGTEIAMEGQEHVLLKEEDVIGVVPGNDRIAQMKPLGDRVLLKCAKAEAQTSGGVLLASESADKPNFGEVVAVGPGKKEGEGDDAKVVAPNVQAGQTVMYSKYSGTEFEDVDETAYIVVRESDILAALA
eukprot:jgi/Chrzof1/8420/Cz03g10020.t1_CPN10